MRPPRHSKPPSPSSRSSRSSKAKTSPPMSPLSPSPLTGKSDSDDESLGDSFMLVSHREGLEDEEGTESSSTIGSLTEVLSDSSGDREEGWDNSTDGGSSVDGRLTYSVPSSPASHIKSIDNVLLGSPQSPSTDSYIDAEATSTSDLTGSRSTIQNGLRSTSSSQVQLIMPDPASSFMTTSSSDGTTPSGSLANLQGVARSRGGTVTSWLEESKGLWTPQLAPAVLLDIDGLEKVEDATGEYMMLASDDNIKEPKVPLHEGEKFEVEIPKTRAEKALSRAQLHVRAALAAVNAAGLKGFARRWSMHMSMLAMASLVSLALLRAYGPATAHVPAARSEIVPDLPVSIHAGRTSMWDRLVSNVPHVTITIDISRREAVATPSPAPLSPDLQLIKQALSTVSTSTKAVDDALAGVYAAREKRKRQETTASAVSCCAVSVRNANHDLVVAEKAQGGPIWRRTLDRMARVNATAAEPLMTMNGTAHLEPCACGLGSYVGSQAISKVLASLPPVHKYAVSVSNYVGQIYAPAIAELHKEFNELLALFRTIAETTSTMSEFVIRRAARGVGVSKHALESASKQIKDHMPPLPHPHVDTEALLRAKQKIDHLSEYVEDQAAVLADYVEEQSAIVHDKSMESLRQAKRGLDKLITEARRAVGEVEEEKIKHLPGPRQPVRAARNRIKIVDRVRERRARRMRSTRPIVVEQRMEERSTAGKVWDAIHHGAMALVL